MDTRHSDVYTCKRVEFIVHGVAAPQGSKTPWGSEANPRTRPWRAAVTAEASQHVTSLIEGPVRVTAVFTFTRPRSHYRTGKNSHLLRDAAPRLHTSKPDLDKLQRAIGDALTGVVLRDDSQIAWWVPVKVYGDSAQTFIRVEPVAEEDFLAFNDRSFGTDLSDHPPLHDGRAG